MANQACTGGTEEEKKRENIPHQCMTDVYLLYFLGQSVENMHLATSISEKP